MMKWKHRVFCLMVTAFHLLYSLVFPSIINGERYFGSDSRLIEPSYIHAFFISRINFGEFARRPVTTWVIQALEWTGIPLEYAFIFTLFGAFFISYLLLWKLAFILTKNELYSSISVGIFTSSFWVIHAIFAEIYGYDEPVQYIFIFASLIFLARQKWVLFSLLFLFALIARESTLLLLPGIYLFFIIKAPLWSKENLYRSLKTLWSLPFYGLFLWLIIENKGLEEKSSSYMRDMRFKHLFYSFRELDLGIDTITSFLMALSIPVTLIYVYRKRFALQIMKPWIWATALNLGFNTFITFIFTMGRETRIFAQPLLLVMPFTGFMLAEWYKDLKHSGEMKLSDYFRLLTISLVFASMVFAISLYAYELYWPTDTKFFTGFQHFVYLSFSICLALLVVSEVYKHTNFGLHKKWFTLILVAIIALFFNNKHGYRAYDFFEPLAASISKSQEQTNRNQSLILATNFPNVAENYFEATQVQCIAGDYNLQLPIKQFLYAEEPFANGDRDLLYLELEPAINFPMRYILSKYGRSEETEVEGYHALLIHTNEQAEVEPYTFKLMNDSNQFQKILAPVDGKQFNIDGEYSPAFKGTLGELGIDSLISIGASTGFKTTINSEAAIVVSIKSPGREDVWEHVYLNIFLINTNGWNTAFKALNFEPYTDPSTEVAFYVWNPKNDPTELRDMEAVLNSKFVSKPKVKRSVLDSRKLE